MASKDERILLKLVEKARLPPPEADALDFKSYNLKHLRYGRAASFASFERRKDVPIKPVYADGIVFGVESFLENYTLRRLLTPLLDVGNGLLYPGITLKDGTNGGREPGLNFVRHTKTCPEEGTGCDTYNSTWPLGVVTFGISRTLPELLEDSIHYFDHPSSDIMACLGIKIYVPTKQMIAFLRVRNGISWVVSFGIEAVGSSTLAVLGDHGLTDRAVGVGLGDEPCSRPGMPTYMRKLDLEMFQVDIDFFAIQQACLLFLLTLLGIHLINDAEIVSVLNDHEVSSIRKKRKSEVPSSDKTVKTVKRLKLSTVAAVAAENSACPKCQNLVSTRLMRICDRELTELPRASHYGNKVEQQTTLNFLQNSQLSIQDVLGYWCSEETASIPICERCADTVVSDAVDNFRMSVPKDDISFKPDCWYGYRCRTQYKLSHAEKLNHMCRGAKLQGTEQGTEQ